jgi:hypothetical protein
MSGNGRRQPPRPRIELVSPAASESEAAAIVAALERFLTETAPVARQSRISPWQAAALREGIGARQVGGSAWGHAPSWADA